MDQVRVRSGAAGGHADRRHRRRAASRRSRRQWLLWFAMFAPGRLSVRRSSLPRWSMLRRHAVEALAASAVALFVTLVIAAPVVRTPSERIFGADIVGWHHDPFTVMQQFASAADAGCVLSAGHRSHRRRLRPRGGPGGGVQLARPAEFSAVGGGRAICSRGTSPCRRPARCWPHCCSPFLPSTSPTPRITRTSRRRSGCPCTCSRCGAAWTRQACVRSRS